MNIFAPYFDEPRLKHSYGLAHMNDIDRIMQIISSANKKNLMDESVLKATAEKILHYVDIERSFSVSTPGNWHIWNGSEEPPVPPDFLVQVQLRDNTQGSLFAKEWNWKWNPKEPLGDIIAYRIIIIDGAQSVN